MCERMFPNPKPASSGICTVYPTYKSLNTSCYCDEVEAWLVQFYAAIFYLISKIFFVILGTEKRAEEKRSTVVPDEIQSLMIKRLQ